MIQKPTYTELENKVARLERLNADYLTAKNTLQKNLKKYQEYFEENISGTYISSPKGRLIDCNSEFLRIFGFTDKQTALATPIEALMVDPLSRRLFLDILQKTKRVRHYRPRLKKIDGSPIHLIENATGIFDDQGNLYRIRGYLLDVTEQKKLQAHLLQAQKMEAIGTLAGGIAHDFNNILSGILGYSQLAKMQIDKPERCALHIDHIIAASHRASALVQQILRFSRQSEQLKRPLKLSSLLKETLKLLRSSIPSNITIHEDIGSNAAVLADSTQVHQVIMNLCTNAYHAMSDTGGTLAVALHEIRSGDICELPGSVSIHDRYLQLLISDTGHGINKENLRRIFDPYYTTKDVGKGTGLGLAVVDGIVKNHDGFINCRSVPGKGTEFKIFWPVIARETDRPSCTNRTITPSRGHERIMLVDDETNILVTLHEFLSCLGYKATTFNDPRSAVKAFTLDPAQFDLIVTDFTMPHMTGDILCKNVLEIRKEIPIILCTGYNENFNSDDARKLGIRKFFLKPITCQELSLSIRSILDSAAQGHQQASMKAC